MKVIYIAGKYRGETESEVFNNIIKARAAAQRFWRLGWAVICPHTNTAFMGGEDDSKFLEGDLELLRRCDAVYFLSGWYESEGATFEHRLATQMGKEIYYEEE